VLLQDEGVVCVHLVVFHVGAKECARLRMKRWSGPSKATYDRLVWFVGLHK
jgi:hypothetical protein